MKLRYTSRAIQDLELALVWYERQRRGLGLEFLDCVESTIQSILSNPRKFRIYYARIRGRVVRRFPFSIFYSIEEHEIVIHSVFDNRQDPAKRP
ncbi:MAG: recombinase [Zetaproteobacteria bacterium CG12_big_fil_rev_8_21_14_0_65_55_1124]|nr:MAG: recombinase [Zetaproteobacteria bacterium CG1_02_55_237]PIS20201.1 MAG: recombinase [Zetaproteobacteria bacterium CG08_land_8_20_14_0_20_55_17]PIW43358.1 MAG: recombinase [Zetaproteobacteria bacterium CG12_big_fil_rev_8_21_14_0_65_55_1124]PIY53065.1 MAG: recombinase [Zetaproteobacteria bacterium CG_4_10_14_0_8_um_filter_55_43]PIZ39974.1 MAG: recombinase [Zetaproteobacteria bacterium CG_4_10_14_0_2_um_filter_55_20]PJB81260.1 MAG: recombinase [Zetaproteobacteria bacterium CG_4_9_14_0_8_u